MAKILIVEDDAANLHLTRYICSSLGHEVIEASNGCEAVKKASQEKPDLILMDLQLPIMSGYEASTKIKNELGLTDVPIIALTAYAMQGDEERGLEAGCDSYVTKPIKKEELESVIKQLLRE